MIDKVYNVLKVFNVPIGYIQRVDFDSKGITLCYHFYNEESVLYGDGAEVECGGGLQVDLFAKGDKDFRSIKKGIKKALIDLGMVGITTTDSSENITGVGVINHVVFQCNYIEGVEE